MWNLRLKLPWLTVLLVAGAIWCGSGCSPAGQKPTDANPVVVTVEVVPAAAVPGESVTLVWRFALAEGWHLYWSGRNDTGYPPRIDLNLPDGWVAGGLQWPAPVRHVAAGDILDHIYEGELILIQKLGAPATVLANTDVVLQAEIQWLACKDMCVPGRTTLTFTIPVRDHATAREPNIASLAADRVPGPLPAGTLETGWQGTTFHVTHPSARRLTFMPTDDCGPLVDLLTDGQGDWLALRFKPKADTVGPVRGLITIERDGAPSRTFRLDVPGVALPAAPSSNR
jgi:DsbC/DsbD-like thiol-disulfide interchange protein